MFPGILTVLNRDIVPPILILIEDFWYKGEHHRV